MNPTPDGIVFAVQTAFLELLELIEQLTQGDGAEGLESFREEAEKTILMFIAAIVLADREYQPAEQAFLSLLVDWRNKPGGEARYLNEYASQWTKAALQAPRFFHAAVCHDRTHKTNIARAMLSQIQLIGNNVCVCDGSCSAAERETVQSYLGFLDEFIETWKVEAASESKPEAASNQFVSITVLPPRRNTELCWIPANEPITIHDYTIPSGMIYTSDGEAAATEASAINTRLHVGQPAIGDAARLNYYSQYRWLSPDQRASYLEWLAAGRKDQTPSTRELGYIFLFFYGLERRLLVDKAQDQEVVAEIVRLLHHYGPHARSRSLQSYFGQLIHFWGWKQGPEYYAQLMEWMKTLPVSLLGVDEMATVLAGHFQSQEPLTSELAYELTARHQDARRSVVISRVNEEFRALFSKRYLEQFPGGMNLQRSKRNVRLEYRPASPTLMQGSRDEFSILVPDVLGLSSQFKLLPDVWNSCIKDLTDFSRAKAKPGDSSTSLKAHLALPEELRVGVSHPLAKRWEEILMRARTNNGCSILDVEDAARLIELPQRLKLTVGQSRDLAQVIESLGFGVEPDARHDVAYAWDQEIAVFKPTSGKVISPSKNFLGASALLKLCVLVAGADGHVSSEEFDVSRRFIEKHLSLDPDDHQRLGVLEQVLIADPTSAKSSLSRIAKRVPKEHRELICEVLVYVAAADNIVTKDEIRALERIFKMFELPVEKLDTHLRTIRPEVGEVTIQTAGDRIPGEAIPAPDQPFRIDMSRVDRIAQETSEVIGILAMVMIEDDSESANTTEVETPLGSDIPQAVLDPAIAQPANSSPEWLTALDTKYHPILLCLVERESWSRSDFNTLVKGFQLMPLDAHDAINEWADEHLGDFLLEGDDPISVHKELII